MNTALKIIFAVLIGLMLVPFKGYAKDGKGGVHIEPSVLFWQDSDKDTVTSSTARTTTTNILNLDFLAGYKFSSGLFVGGEYVMNTAASTTTGSATVNTDDNGYGPTVGFMKNGFEIAGTYVFSMESKLSQTVTLKKGSGFNAHIAYLFMVTPSFSIGPKFIYYNWTYSEKSTAPTALTNKYEKSGIAPFVTLAFTF